MTALISELESIVVSDFSNNLNKLDCMNFNCKYIGHECNRYIWLKSRLAVDNKIDIKEIKKIIEINGIFDFYHNYFNKLEGCIVRANDRETGDKIKVIELNGHLECAPNAILKHDEIDKNSYVIYSHIVVSSDKLNKLKALIAKNKYTALQEFDLKLYAYAMVSTYLFGFNRHYLLMSSHGNIETIELITELDEEPAIYYLNRLYNILSNDNIPKTISNSGISLTCHKCEFNKFCHKTQIPNANCRTCGFCEIGVEQGDNQWYCAYHNKVLSNIEQLQACNYHLFIPDLLINVGNKMGYDKNTHCINYKSKDGSIYFNNGNRKICSDKSILSSKELKTISDYAAKSGTDINTVIYYVIKDDSILANFRETFDSEVKSYE